MKEIEFAIVKDAKVFVEDHGCKIFSLELHYNGGGSVQGAGLYVLDRFVKKLGKRVMSKEAMEIVPMINELFDVKDWSKIKGQWVYALHDNGCVYAIGRYSWQWLDFKYFFGTEGVKGRHELIDFKQVIERHPDSGFHMVPLSLRGVTTPA